MSAKQTGELKVLTDQLLSEKELVINPNDGFDLGIMMTEATVELIFGSNSDQAENNSKYPAIQAQLIQKNDCRLGTLELGSKSILKLDGNTIVRLFLEEQDDYPILRIGPV